jgi:GrpB-like predicted nucleotidyltransferase (UPF0157 family)
MSSRVMVEEYNPEWSKTFESLKDRILPLLIGVSTTIEHVGSTSVEGLAAKPVIDMDIVVDDKAHSKEAIARLKALGYVHVGDYGIPGREAFKRPFGTLPHNLYVCLKSSLSLKNHLLLRDYLRAHNDARDAYAKLKKEMAAKFPNDVDQYCEGKTDFLVVVLRKAGVTEEELAEIDAANRLVK